MITKKLLSLLIISFLSLTSLGTAVADDEQHPGGRYILT